MRTMMVWACLVAGSGCGQRTTDGDAPRVPPEATTQAPVAPADALPPAPVSAPAPAAAPAPAPAPAAAPTPSAPPPAESVDPKSTAAAALVVEQFATLLEQRHFVAAYRLSSGAGATPQGEARFVATYGKYVSIHAKVGAPGASEGGAGSIYVEVPLTLTGTLRSGRRVTLVGPVSLRRVNDVDGASPAQLRWHIFQSAIEPRR